MYLKRVWRSFVYNLVFIIIAGCVFTLFLSYAGVHGPDPILSASAVKWVALATTLLFALALIVPDVIGFRCDDCGARGAWHEATITALSESHLCPHCRGDLESPRRPMTRQTRPKSMYLRVRRGEAAAHFFL